MEKLKKQLPLILFAIAFYFLLNSIFKPKQNAAEAKVSYKEGTYYERIIIENKSFLNKIISSFSNKKEKIEDIELKDILQITFTNDKIESINIEKNELLDPNNEEIKKLLESVVSANSTNVQVPETIKREGKLILSAISNASAKSINRSKARTTKIRPGRLSTIIKNNDKFMEINLTIDPSKIDNISVLQNSLSDNEMAEIETSMKKIMNEKSFEFEEPVSGSDSYKAFISGINDILMQEGLTKNWKIIQEKSNVVWQGLKDIIAGSIKFIYRFVKNYGIAIIIATIIIKVLLLPLTLKQDKSMKEMKKLQPEMDKIKEKYKDNVQLQQQKTMELYKKYHINPAGGCLPLLVQMPILIALFGVLRSGIVPETAEIMKDINAIYGYLIGPRFLWMDLVNPDPIYVMPILTTAVTYLQQKMMGASQGGNNPMMKNMGIIMPLMMGYISLKMPSGVQLYWLISTVLAVVQQYFIMKKGE